MASNIDVSGFSSDRYFARAWRLVTQEKGWWKPVLIMAVAVLVPIVGPLAVLGYQLEWARLIAWDVNEPMRRHDIHVGELIVSGWRGFVAMLGWGIANALIGNLLSEVPGLGGLLDLAWTVCGIFISMMIMVAAIRATIYQKIGAGYSAKNLWQMATRDLGGLARVWLIDFVASIIEGIIAIAILVGSVISAIPNIAYSASILYDYGSMMSERELAFYTFDLLGTLFGSIWPALLLLILITLFLGALVTTITFAALALWMRQFDVPAWGKSSDPLPASVVEDAAEKDDEVPVAPAMPVDEPVAKEKAPEALVEAAVEAPVAQEPIEVVPPIPGDEPEVEDDDVDEGAEKTEVLDTDTEVETEVIAPARAEEPASVEVFDNDAEASDDTDPAKTNDDPASSDEEETQE